MKSLCRKESGFTVIELIVVLAIMGVLTATAASKFANLSSNSPFSIDPAANMIESDIRYVQELAMATHQPQGISFSGGNYSLPGVSEPRDLQGVTTSSLIVTFNPFGEPIVGGGQSLTVGGIKAVTITNYTGKVIVQ